MEKKKKKIVAFLIDREGNTEAKIIKKEVTRPPNFCYIEHSSGVKLTFKIDKESIQELEESIHVTYTQVIV